MPRTKQPKRALKAAAPPADVNGAAGEVLTLAEAAAYLRLPESDVLHAIQEQGRPARQVGAEWRFFKAAIQQWLSSGAHSLPANKAAWLAMAGKSKDDPDLEQIVEDAYRRRGRPITEDGSYKNFSH